MRTPFYEKGVNIQTNIDTINNDKPHIVVGTPGRILDLATKRKALDLSHVKHFVLDECDRMLAELDMRRDVQTIFRYRQALDCTEHELQPTLFIHHSVFNFSRTYART